VGAVFSLIDFGLGLISFGFMLLFGIDMTKPVTERGEL
jgi:hypothetical protein